MHVKLVVQKDIMLILLPVNAFNVKYSLMLFYLINIIEIFR
jgi:hypothetical protein